MTRAEFLTTMDELLELPPGTLRGPEQLEDIEQWDSMAVIGLISLVNSKTGMKVAPRDIASCSTVDDLAQLAKVEA